MTTTDPLATINLRETPVSEQAVPGQVKNRAGGYVFAVDPLTQLRRFLVMGTTGGTYYAGQHELTRENTDVVLDLARTRGSEVVAEVVTISTAGRAPKNDQALWTLAAVLAVGDNEAKKAARLALPLVARTGTHLFQVVGYLERLRGWGKVARRAVSGWYEDKDADSLAFQVAKYRERKGWTHRDVLRSAHPKAPSAAHRAVYDWVSRRGADSVEARPAIIDAFLAAQSAETPAATARLVEEHGLAWEMLRTEHLTSPVVWEALLGRGMPQTALIRNLPRLTNLGLIGPSGLFTKSVAAQLADTERMRKGKVHPINVLVAMRTYARGVSERGDTRWAPVSRIVDALDAGFYAAFPAVEPTGKRIRLAIDISGSMDSQVSGLPLSCREACAALALTTLAVEDQAHAVGFTAGPRGGLGGRWNDGDRPTLTALDISPRRRLDDVARYMKGLPMGGTDVSLPILDALERGIEVDTFHVWTDGETWAGIHPYQALDRYRRETGINARLVVAAMTANGTSIANPNDPGMLDVAGMDSATPQIMADFGRGAF